MAHLEAAFDATVDGKKFKKGDKLPSELSNFPLAKIVEDDSKSVSEKKVVLVSNIPKVEPKKVIKKK